MKKVILSASAIAVVTALIAPKLAADKIQKSVDVAIAAINEQPYYQATLKDAEFGWFSSKGTISIGFDSELMAQAANDPEAFTGEIAVDINFKTSQGLFNDAGFGLAGFEISLPLEQARAKLKWAEDTPLYQVNGKIGLGGAISYQDKSAEFTLADEEGELYVAAYSGEAVTKGGDLYHKGQLPKLTFKTATEGEFLIENFTTDTVIPPNIFEVLSETSFYDSEFKMNIENLEANSLGEIASLVISNLSLDGVSKVSEDKKLGDMVMSYKAKKVTVDGWEGNDLEMGLALNNMDIEAFDHFNKSMTEMSLADPSAAESDFQALFTKNLLKILQVEPEINITELKGTIPEGQFDAKLNSKLVDIQALPQNLEDPIFWLSHLSASSEVLIDKPVMQMLVKNVVRSQIANNPQAQGMTPEEIEQIAEQQAPATIQMLTAQGILIENGEKFESKFELKDKQATLNGNPMPLPMLQ